MAIQIFDERAAALRGEDASEAFLKSESEAIEKESAEIQLEAAALTPECEEWDTLVADTKSFCAIGFANLDESQRAEMLKVTERAQALKGTLGPKYEAFKARCAKHEKRQDALIAALRKRIEFDQGKQVKVMQDFAGLLAYGMASGQLSEDWQFAKSVVDDYQKAKTPEDRAAHFNTFSLVLKGIESKPQGDPTGRNVVMINPSRAGQEQIAIYERFTQMPAGEEKSAFYAKHSVVIKAVEDLKKLN